MTCAICGSTTIDQAFSGVSEILRCRQCSTGFLAPQAVPYQPESYYREAENYAEVLGQPQRLERIRRNAREVLGIIRAYTGASQQKLLDIGAHTGMLVQEAEKIGFQASGIELNAQVVAWAQQHGIAVTRGTLSELPEEETFDIITISHVLEHVQDPTGLLRDIRDRLHPGGILAIEVPNAASYLAHKDGPSWKFIALEHLFYFTGEGLMSLLKRSGFSILHARKRNDELRDLNVRKLVRYFWGPGLQRNRLTMKAHVHGNVTQKGGDGITKRILKKILIEGIKLLGREDHILFVARKI